jgi:hypothetical protein
LWGYYSPTEVVVKSRIAPLESYIWGDREVEFMRCSNCGCVTHYVTTELCSESVTAVNFRLFELSVVEAIPVRKLCYAVS